MRTFLALSAALLLAACGGKPSDAPSASGGAEATLHFSAIPGEGDTKLEEKFSRFARYLAAELGVPVEYRAAADYGASVRMFAKGEIQLAWFGGLTGVQARAKVAGARAIAQGAEDPQYYSYFIAHKDAGVEASDSQDVFPKGLEGKTFTFGADRSTSGRLMPEYFIRKFTGKSPRQFFGRAPQFSGKHPLTAKAVEAGTVQAGALSYRTYDKMVADGRLDPEKCRVVWKTPFYADYNFTAHPLLDVRYGGGFIARLQKAILAFDDEDVLENGFQRSKLIGATNEDFQRIGELAEALGFLGSQ